MNLHPFKIYFIVMIIMIGVLGILFQSWGGRRFNASSHRISDGNWIYVVGEKKVKVFIEFCMK